MANIAELLNTLEKARELLSNPGNDFSWSSWEDAEAATVELDKIIATIRSGALPENTSVSILFLPTGPIQEVSLSSGWGDEFIDLADRFDKAMSGAPQAECGCKTGPDFANTVFRDLGMDERYAEVSIIRCSQCGQAWLRYFYEIEAFSKSGRWYLGPIVAKLAESLTARDAKAAIEELDWYFFGGSYFEGSVGKASGPIGLNP